MRNCPFLHNKISVIHILFLSQHSLLTLVSLTMTLLKILITCLTYSITLNAISAAFFPFIIIGCILFRCCLLYNRLQLDRRNQWIRRRKWNDLKLHLCRAPPHLFCFSFSVQFWLGNLGMNGVWDGGGGCCSSPPGQTLIWASELSTPCSFLLATSFLGGGASIPPESCSTYGGQGAQLHAKACWDSTPFISQLQGWVGLIDWAVCVEYTCMCVTPTPLKPGALAEPELMWWREGTGVPLRARSKALL